MSQKKMTWDYVLTFPIEDLPDGKILGCIPSPGEKLDASVRRKSRKDIVRKIKAVGLVVSKLKAKDGDSVYLRIGIPEPLLDQMSEKFLVKKKLKKAFGSIVTEFKIEDKDNYIMDTEHHFFRSSVRQNIILQVIQGSRSKGGADIDLKKLLKEEIISQMFPLHDLNRRNLLLKKWVRSVKSQPLDDIRDYFGEAIGFYFAWLGYYTKWLFFASIFGVLMWINQIVNTTESSGKDTIFVPIYAIFLAIWITLFLEFWKRRNASLAYKWDMMDFEETEITRPAYFGEEKTGKYVNGIFLEDIEEVKEKDIYYPTWKRTLKYIFGFPIMATLILIVVAGLIGLIALKNSTKSRVFDYLGGIINAVVIVTLNYLYKFVAKWLNDWENHRTASEYSDSLITKTFVFQFVNSYISLFYIAFFKDAGQCLPSKNCMEELHIQLASILITKQAIGNFKEIVIPWAMSKYKIKKEEKEIEEEMEEKAEDAGATEAEAEKKVEEAKKKGKLKLSRIEKEAKLASYGGTFGDFNEMIIQFGYVTLFGAAFPGAPVFALINNIIEIRSDAFKLLKETQRPESIGAEDIGSWQKILELMGYISVVTNCALLAFTSKQFSIVFGGQLNAVIMATALGLFLLSAKWLIASLINDRPYSVRKEIAEDKYNESLNLKELEEIVDDFEEMEYGDESDDYDESDDDDFDNYD